MIGLVVHRLTVIADTERGHGWHKYWLTKCECGNEKEVRADHLRNKKIMSCGCLRREMKLNLRHGCSRTVEYETWIGMKGRCYNQNDKEFARYGGRGISVCDRWLDSFEKFLSDMGPRPNGGSIERKDVNGDYSPSNCVWLARNLQGRNQRRTKLSIEKAREIRRLRSAGLTYKELRERFGVGDGTIAFVLGNKQWREDDRRAK